LPVEQQSIVRYWTRRQGEILLSPADVPLVDASGEDAVAVREEQAVADPQQEPEAGELSRRFDLWRMARFAIPVALMAGALGWWQWERGWSELEEPAQEAMSQQQLQVAGDVMAQRIAYRVMPEYPEAARQAGLQGVVVLDTAVSAEGAVTAVKYLSGPEELSQAAMDAVRWWRYDPYVVGGQPKAVETTVAVEFRLTN
jgi:TonB family protein